MHEIVTKVASEIQEVLITYSILIPESSGEIAFEFSLNVFTEFTEFSDKKYHFFKTLFEIATSCVRDQDAATAPVRHRYRKDLKIEPISCFSDLSYSLNSLNSLNF